MMAPPQVINYLVAHEVAHLKEMNHSANFWALCKELCPETDKCKSWLKRNGNKLGAIQSQRFGFDDVECLGFSQYWGQSGGDFSSAGTNLLYGYYCADPGKPLSDETRKAVIGGLDIKE